LEDSQAKLRLLKADKKSIEEQRYEQSQTLKLMKTTTERLERRIEELELENNN
jgi:hypothetical protein